MAALPAVPLDALRRAPLRAVSRPALTRLGHYRSEWEDGSTEQEFFQKMNRHSLLVANIAQSLENLKAVAEA